MIMTEPFESRGIFLLFSKDSVNVFIAGADGEMQFLLSGSFALWNVMIGLKREGSLWGSCQRESAAL